MIANRPARDVEQIADANDIRQSTATHDKREPSCVWPNNASAFRSVDQDTLDQRVRRHEANVGYLSLAVGVANDRSIIRPRMMLEAGNHLSSCWVQKLHPPARLQFLTAEAI